MTRVKARDAAHTLHDESLTKEKLASAVRSSVMEEKPESDSNLLEHRSLELALPSHKKNMTKLPSIL